MGSAAFITQVFSKLLEKEASTHLDLAVGLIIVSAVVMQSLLCEGWALGPSGPIFLGNLEFETFSSDELAINVGEACYASKPHHVHKLRS